ncbi:MAG TPA: hypothetical protein VGK24_17955 [Candidatus Angelobacter sp.]|jgi:hypothetical protein
MAASGMPSWLEEKAEENSQDFVEHLRTVHFALLASCIALFVVLTSPTPADFGKAEAALGEINDIATTWNPHLMKAAFDRKENEIAAQCNKELPSVYADDGSKIYLFKFERTQFLRESRAKWYFLTNYFEGLDGVSSPASSFQSPPNLAKFRELWDSSFTVLCPTGVGDQAQFSQPNQTSSYLALQPFPNKLPPELAAKPRVDVKLTAVMQLAKTGSKAYGEEVPVFAGGYNDGRRFVTIETPASWITPTDKVRWRDEIILARPNSHLVHADFKSAFPELAAVAKDDIQDMRLGDLSKLLGIEMNFAKVSFEAFGIRFPAENTSRWGVLLVLGIQLYFWLHFREYRKRSPGSSIAWIGAYGDRVSRSVFQTTALLLPIATVVFAAVHTPTTGIRLWDVYLSTAAIAASILISAFTLIQYNARLAKLKRGIVSLLLVVALLLAIMIQLAR